MNIKYESSITYPDVVFVSVILACSENAKDDIFVVYLGITVILV